MVIFFGWIFTFLEDCKHLPEMSEKEKRQVKDRNFQMGKKLIYRYMIGSFMMLDLV